MTLEDLSKIYNVSRERIHQIEVSALRELKAALTQANERLQAA